MPHKTSRHSPGEGSIAQRQDGRWQASLQVDGHRRTVYGKTRQEVVAKLEALKRQALQAGALPDPGKRTLNDLLDAWLEVKAATVKPRTLADYEDICERYLRGTLGTLRLDKVTPDRIQRLYARYQAKGQSRTALKCHRVLSQALALAVRWGWLAHSPCERVEAPRHRYARKELWTYEQLQAFLEGTKEHWAYPLWLTLIASGCRLGEAMALTWQDVDFEAGTLHVCKTLQRVNGTLIIGEPKTRAGERVIALPQEVVQVLKQQKGRQILAQAQGWRNVYNLVFPSPAGLPLQRSVVSHCLRRECQRLGLPLLSAHGLRHLHASLLLAAGLPVPLVSKRLGHANPGITMAIYAHALGKDDRAATEAIARALGPEGGGTM